MPKDDFGSWMEGRLSVVRSLGSPSPPTTMSLDGEGGEGKVADWEPLYPSTAVPWPLASALENLQGLKPPEGLGAGRRVEGGLCLEGAREPPPGPTRTLGPAQGGGKVPARWERLQRPTPVSVQVCTSQSGCLWLAPPGLP